MAKRYPLDDDETYMKAREQAKNNYRNNHPCYRDTELAMIARDLKHIKATTQETHELLAGTDNETNPGLIKDVDRLKQFVHALKFVIPVFLTVVTIIVMILV